MAKKYYKYVADIKDTTCKDCSSNDGRIFSEYDAPILPLHPNCNCKLILVETEKKTCKKRFKIKHN
jgi:hypothetical protein